MEKNSLFYSRVEPRFKLKNFAVFLRSKNTAEFYYLGGFCPDGADCEMFYRHLGGLTDLDNFYILSVLNLCLSGASRAYLAKPSFSRMSHNSLTKSKAPFYFSNNMQNDD